MKILNFNKSVFLTLFLFFTTLSPIHSQAALSEEGDLGVGIILGWPTGFTGKYKITPPDQVIDFGMGWHIGNSFTLYGDYLFEFHNAFQNENEFINSLILYAGAGALFEFIASSSPDYRNPSGKNRTSNTLIALRIPLGIEWPLPNHPIRLGFEIVPGMSAVPYTSLIIQGALTGRYFF